MSESILFLEGTAAAGFAMPESKAGPEDLSALRTVSTFEELESLLESGHTRLVLVGLHTHDDFLILDRALWAASRSNRPVPVVALVESYNTADALLCFQMGVADYVGLREHSSRLQEMLSALAGSKRVEDSAGPNDETRARVLARSRRGRVESASTTLL